MSSILLKTKLHIPPARSEWMRRTRLFERLGAGLRRKLTLVSAPAGFGKTTLISAWLHEQETPAAWLSLEPEDNQIARFWYYMVAALQSIDARIGESLLSMLRSSPDPPIEDFLTELLNDVGEVRTPFVLVLDDFQMIENAQIQDTLLFLLDHQPLAMHLVLSTRVDPPWPLARLRGQGEMIEVRVDDLRFSLEETAEFLNVIMGLDLVSEDVILLDERTEGWIVGLHMAALSMQGRTDRSAFIHTFTGSHRFVLDYLIEEVLEQQSSARREFLLKTSILQRLTSSLCDALLNANDSRAILKQLEDENLFLITLDDERRWFRYHPLFAEFLRVILHQQFPGIIPELHRKASQWFVRYGMLTDAVNHAFMADDLEYVAHLIEDNTLIAVMIFNDHLPSLAAWMNRLPEWILRTRPWLALARAWVLAYAGELNAAEAVFQEVERIISARPGEMAAKGLDLDQLAGYLAAIRGYWFFMKGDTVNAAEWMRKARPLLPGSDAPTRIFAAIVLGAAIGIDGDLAGGIGVLSEAVHNQPEARYPLFRIMILCELAGLQILTGRLKQVIATCEEVLQLAHDDYRSMGIYPPNIGFAYARLSYVLREQNDLDAAIRSGQEAVKISRSWGQKDSLCTSNLYLALALQSAGKGDEAIRKMNDTRRVTSGLSRSIDARTAAYEARLHAGEDDLSFLIRWREESGLDSADVLTFGRLREYIVYARALMIEGNIPACLALLGRLQLIADAAGAMLYVIEASILQALAFYAQGELEQAMLPLAHALRLAEPEGYVRVFVDEGARIKALLQQAAQQGPSKSYATRLLVVLDAEIETKKRRGLDLALQPSTSLRQVLTPRELEILEKLAIPRSIPDIATELCIETSTLRTHLRNIYDKLGVHSRLEAVALYTQEDT